MSFMYEVGKTYVTVAGYAVKVTGRTTLKGYECLECSDGKYRYDRSTGSDDAGRCTGGDWSDDAFRLPPDNAVTQRWQYRVAHYAREVAREKGIPVVGLLASRINFIEYNAHASEGVRYYDFSIPEIAEMLGINAETLYLVGEGPKKLPEIDLTPRTITL